MSSKFYTNVVLTVIAVLLAGILLKGFVSFPMENKVFADDEKYKEFRTVQTLNYELDKRIQENVKEGWKPISISQSQADNQPSPNITVLMAK